DYLDDVLNAFGFGSRWRSWIQGSLNSGKASILVNGSPTSEFQLHRRLKQGDPLAPFLFILIIESLHHSFNRVVEAGIFTGLRIDDTLAISHLFYADDAIFIGEWSKENLKGILNILNCFSLLSRMTINLKKSHILGLGIRGSTVSEAAASLGCSVMKTSSNYLGIMVPKTVLNKMENLRRNFFNGIQEGDRKITGGIEEHQLEHLVALLDSIILSNSNDRWVSDLNGDGVFRVKDVRNLLDEFFLPRADVPTRWVKNIPIKVNIFAWRLALDRLPTRTNLVQRSVVTESQSCPLCDAILEDTSHLFFNCSLARD
nr:RNA-directed DNA polymerase, eukaryota, reverse transcriptase zinc-binding domain protein [Tanacetum cinerariifolium]